MFSRQVFEHVRHPDALMREVARVLKPGGVFFGSVAYLEPYHSRSIFNFTPYGLMTVLGNAGLRLSELRPGIDPKRAPLLCLVSVFGVQLVGAPDERAAEFDQLFSLYLAEDSR